MSTAFDNKIHTELVCDRRGLVGILRHREEIEWVVSLVVLVLIVVQHLRSRIALIKEDNASSLLHLDIPAEVGPRHRHQVRDNRVCRIHIASGRDQQSLADDRIL